MTTKSKLPIPPVLPHALGHRMEDAEAFYTLVQNIEGELSPNVGRALRWFFEECIYTAYAAGQEDQREWDAS